MTKKVYDLEGRTAKFGEDVIEFAKKVPKKYYNYSSNRPIDKGRNKCWRKLL